MGFLFCHKLCNKRLIWTIYFSVFPLRQDHKNLGDKKDIFKELHLN